MTDNDIRDFIEGCEQPIIMKDVLNELREDDPTVSFKRVARILRDMGFENHCRKSTRNLAGRGSSWTRENTPVRESDEDETEETEEKPRSTADALSDVDAQNETNARLSAKLFESLQTSRSLKEELMRRQQEALLELARRILGLYGSERERRTYGGF